MRRPPSMLTALLLTIALAAAPRPAHAQLWKKLKDKVQKKVDTLTDAALDSAVNKGANAVTCVATNPDCIAAAQKSGKPVRITDASGKAVSSADSAQAVATAGSGSSAAAPASGEGGTAGDLPSSAFVNFDFVPGDSVLFAEDFANDRVGDAPQRLIPTQGDVEVADYLGERWARTTSSAIYEIDLADTLPQRFTFEADFIAPTGWDINVDFANGADGFDKVYFGMPSGVGNFSASPITDIDSHRYRGRIMVDGRYVKVYVDGKRVANAPRVNIGRSNRVRIELAGTDDRPGYITNVRLAAGSHPILWDALNASGRVATHGILFATGSAHIRPESAPTLKDIGDMLKAHADLKLTIEGHTDNTGNAASNQALSAQRAQAVKDYLVANFHIDAARLDTKGYGASKPVGNNDTAEGRQQNRRVELVKR